MVHTSTRPYKLFFEYRPHYLYAYVESAQNSYEIAKGYWVEILSMFHRRHHKRILIDKNVAQRLHAHDVLRLVSGLAHSDCGPARFAILDRHYDAKACHLEELIATNRGVQLKISDDQFELEEWLIDGSSVAPDRRTFPHAAAIQRHSASAPH